MTPVLREVLALGGRTGSQELMDWARGELNGYGPHDALPEYRKASAPLALDGMTFHAQVKGQTLAPFSLPDFAQGDITNDLLLRMPISQIEHLARTTADGAVVRLSPPGADDLVVYMNSTGAWNGHIERIYWAVSPVVLVGVIEGVRTALVSLTAQLHAATPPSATVPSPEATTASVHVAVYGDRSMIKNVTINNAAEGATVNVGDDEKRPLWQRPWALVGGVVTLAGVVLGLMQVQGWHF